MFNVITWTADPIIFTLGPIQLRWYALMFIIGFSIGVKIMEYCYKRDGIDPERVYTLFVYCFLGTLIGARLGHCLFYAPDYYLAHPMEILKTWKGGLASHGGTIGVCLGVWIYAVKDKLDPLWVFDRLSIAVAPVAALIRMGNLFNHEIYGHPTDKPWAFRFIENIPQWQHGAEPVFSAPSHPTQIYEALCYLMTMFVCFGLYRTSMRERRGFIFGTFFLCIFGTRFLIEFVKNDQEAFEADMTLNMGQLLSIPIVLLGIYFMVTAKKKAQ